MALGTTSMPMGRGPVLATRVSVGTMASVSTGSGGGVGGHAGDGGSTAADGSTGQVVTSTTTAGTYLSTALL